jgi:MFS family permease
MMFLEFFIWGAWFVTMGTYLSKELSSEGFQIAAAYSTQSLGAIIAPFIIGLIADRFFAAQKILGILHIVGAILMYMAAQSGKLSVVFYPLYPDLYDCVHAHTGAGEFGILSTNE